MVRHRLWLALFLAGIGLALLAGCFGGSDSSSGGSDVAADEPENGEPPDAPPKPGEDPVHGAGELLSPGEMLNVDGVLLGLHPDADLEGVEVLVEWIDPSDESSFPADDERFTGFDRVVQVTAVDTEEDWVPTSDPFLIGIPVPEGFDEDHVYPLQFMYGDFVDFHDEHEDFQAPDVWTTRAGAYDPAYRIYFVPLASIGGPHYPTRIGLAEHAQPQSHEVGSVVDDLLREHFPGLDLERKGEPEATPSSAYARTRGQVMHPMSHAPGHTAGFKVICDLQAVLASPILIPVSGQSTGGSELDCDTFADALTTIQQALDDALPVYQEMNHSGRPKLIESVFTMFSSSVSLYHYYFFNEGADASCENYRGFYRRNEQLAVTCRVTVNSGLDRVRLTTAHELFHAMQYSFGHTSRHSFVMEGTARLTEDINGLTELSGIEGLLRVDQPLTDQRPYRGEHFFYYLLHASDLEFPSLGDMFSRGLRMEHVDEFVQAETPFDDLGDAYWNWAKDIAFEQGDPLAGNFSAGPCAFDWRTAEPQVIDYAHIAPPSNFTFTLNPLSSRVMRINLHAMPEQDYAVELGVSSGSEHIRVKFYDDDHRGSTACQVQPDDNQITVDVLADQSRTIYVLVSNTSPSVNASATMQFPGDPPAMEILSPAAGTGFDEGDTIAFLAVASGLKGANPDTLSISWGYENDLGTYIGLGSSDNGETLAIGHLCDGTYTVVAEASSPGSGLSVSDSVTFSVRDLGATDPPPECPVTADIIEPSDGATFALGQEVVFRGIVDDSRRDSSEPRYPVTWRFNGLEMGTAPGTLEFSRSKFTPGEWEVELEYGAASDRITIHIEDTDRVPPEVSITSPADGTHFTPWGDEGNPGSMGIEIDFTGTATDNQDGTLSGDSLVWSRREVGSSSWISAGTGSSTTMYFGYQCDWQNFEIRLEAENSAGLTESDTIAISIQSPAC
ncbi:MAG: hypothetical protein JJT90_14950 [Ectothiorhodospiraceae bacterium]|nr:hypothetical protein [Ectothiorhodospiraceae bacterium]